MKASDWWYRQAQIDDKRNRLISYLEYASDEVIEKYWEILYGDRLECGGKSNNN